ncbi:hypothetical protein ABZP36_014736 [Zizania latifolia]
MTQLNFYVSCVWFTSAGVLSNEPSSGEISWSQFPILTTCSVRLDCTVGSEQCSSLSAPASHGLTGRRLIRPPTDVRCDDQNEFPVARIGLFLVKSTCNGW